MAETTLGPGLSPGVWLNVPVLARSGRLFCCLSPATTTPRPHTAWVQLPEASIT